MPDKPRAHLKCPYCQSELDLTINSWLHCRKCRRDIMLASPDKQPSSACLYVALLLTLIMIVVYAKYLFL